MPTDTRVLIGGPRPSDYVQFENEGNEATNRKVSRAYDEWSTECPVGYEPAAYKPGNKPVRVAISCHRTLLTQDELADQLSRVVDYCLHVWAQRQLRPGTRVSLVLHRWSETDHELQYCFSNEATELGRRLLLEDFAKFEEYVT